MSSMIITDVEALHTVSTPASVVDNQASEDTQKIIRELVSTIPETGAGLAAPQINFFKRVFVADFPDRGMYVFVNPTVTQSGSPTTSTEGCLSLPGIHRTVWRSSKAQISADVIYRVNTEYKDVAETIPHFDDLVETVSEIDELSGVDAFIVQHEFDHLEGVLITDLKEFVSCPEEVIKKDQERRQRIQQKRLMKKQAEMQKQSKKKVKPNPKKEAKLRKMLKSSDKRKKKQLAIEEYHKAVEEGTIKSR